MPLNRRQVLQAALSGTIFLNAGARSNIAMRPREKIAAPLFPQGVASADPTPDAVMLWTRIEPTRSADVIDLQLLVSESDDFDAIVINETVPARRVDDYTVRVFIDGLQSDRHYYFQFIGAGGASRIGRTHTAPAAESDRKVTLAFASCQNYEQGYFGAWARMISDDLARAESDQIDFVLHLGDFIYERYRGSHSYGERYARSLPDFPDGKQVGHTSYAWSLADYRHLYKVYLADPQLQAARARWPFICTWDDHEFSNDSYQGVSSYTHEPVGHQRRKLDANRAWFEFVPACLDDLSRSDPSQHAHDFKDGREVVNGPLGKVDDTGLHGDKNNLTAIASLHIYRQLRWGRHVDLLITDLRSFRSAPAIPAGLTQKLGLPIDPVTLVAICDGGRAYNGGNPPELLPFGDGTTANPCRDRNPGTMLGARQKDWFKTKMKTSSATWKVWGNSIPCLPLRLDLGAVPFQGAHDSILIQDAWAGYPGELQELLSFAELAGVANLVSLSGDHHLHAAAALYTGEAEQKKPTALDFATSGISSTPNWESVISDPRTSHPIFGELSGATVGGKVRTTWNMAFLDGVLATLAYAKTGALSLSRWLGPNKSNRGLRYVDSDSNGYGIAVFDKNTLKVQLVTVMDTRKPHAPSGPPIKRTATFDVASWSIDSGVTLPEPTFSGEVAFPYSNGTEA